MASALLESDTLSRDCTGTDCASGKEIEVGLLTGGLDPHYAIGLAKALGKRGVRLDFIGSDELDSPDLRNTPGLRFLNLRGNKRPAAKLFERMSRVLSYYIRLLRYALVAQPRIFHILWNNKFEFFDRTFLMLYYKALGKKIVLTVHNVNAGQRDLNDSWLNRITLKIQYALADHLFVHTEKMKGELVRDFGIGDQAITVINYPFNTAVVQSELSCAGAKRLLGIRQNERTLLFFGSVRPYKGLEHLIEAFRQLVSTNAGYRLIIAGEAKKETEDYLRQVRELIEAKQLRERVIERFDFIPDEEIEIFFKAADVLVLPYKHIFQSGVLFLGFAFGLPAIATDVGSFKEELVEGETGFVCRPEDPTDLSKTIKEYFESALFKELEFRRSVITRSVEGRHSWGAVSKATQEVYRNLCA